MALSNEIDVSAQAGAASLAGSRILVVDDEEDVRTYVATVLSDAGARVIEAADGDEAIALAVRERPDLITLDLCMPGRDGVGTFDVLRSTAELSAIPICVVTGHAEFRKVIEDRPLPPPEEFLEKPIEAELLLAAVQRILRTKRSAAARAGG